MRNNLGILGGIVAIAVVSLVKNVSVWHAMIPLLVVTGVFWYRIWRKKLS